MPFSNANAGTHSPNANNSAKCLIRLLLDGGAPDNTDPEDCAEWTPVVRTLLEAHAVGGSAEVRRAYVPLSNNDPALAALVEIEQKPITSLNMTEMGRYFGVVRWVWKDWIPRGHLTILAGDSGVGKSHLAASLIAALTGAAPFPDGSQVTEPGKVCLVETEEFRGPYVERLLARGVKANDICFPVLNGDPTYLLDLVTELPLIAAVAESNTCKAIVVDSLSAGHALDENSADMRGLLKGLAKLAVALDVPMVLVHHVRKRASYETDRITLDRIRGSSTIIQFCRTVCGLWKPDPQTATVRVECLKSSFAYPPSAFGYSVIDNVAHFQPAPEVPRSETTIDKAAELLRVALRTSPQRYATLLEQAESQGISKNSLYKARERLGILVKNGLWSLPARRFDDLEPDPFQ